MREQEITRTTAETKIVLKLQLDGTVKSVIDSGVGCLDHMLTLFAKHGRFDLSVKCLGDVDVDDHLCAEDIGICLGDAFRAALGDMRGITRYGDIILPMDESLTLAAVDISGRGKLCMDLPIPTEKVGTFGTELVAEFFEAFVRRADITLHIRKLAGENSHHIIEGAFKAVARALRKAGKLDADTLDESPSTKGVL